MTLVVSSFKKTRRETFKDKRHQRKNHNTMTSNSDRPSAAAAATLSAYPVLAISVMNMPVVN